MRLLMRALHLLGWTLLVVVGAWRANGHLLGRVRPEVLSRWRTKSRVHVILWRSSVSCDGSRLSRKAMCTAWSLETRLLELVRRRTTWVAKRRWRVVRMVLRTGEVIVLVMRWRWLLVLLLLLWRGGHLKFGCG